MHACRSTLEDPTYLVWTERGPPNGTNIYIAAMANPWTLTGPQTAISVPEFDWETRGHRVNEAPAVLVRNGRVFVAYSASATDANYCVGLLAADENADLLDPKSWKKSPRPVLGSYAPAGQFGPGHNSFTTRHRSISFDDCAAAARNPLHRSQA